MAKADFKGKSGNDYAVYDVGAHTRDSALYDGGSGVDTLELRMTRAQFDLARADILRYLEFIADRTNGNGQASGKTFEFRAFDLDVKHFEQLVVRVDGQIVDPRSPDNPVDAVDDAGRVAANATLAGNVTANDSAPDAPGSVTLVSGPALGSLALGANGAYTYTPGAAFGALLAGQSATQTFTYRLTDVDGDSDLAQVTLTIDGVARRALDGYIAGATVFADADADGTLDAGEASAITGGSGEFVLNAPGTLILRGGTDIATGLPFAGELRAPEGYAVVTALTTLVSVLEANGLAVAEAQAKVLGAFGLNAATDLATLDPIAGTLAGSANAEAAFVAGSAVLNGAVMLASLVDGASTDVDFGLALSDALLSIAQSIDALGAGERLDLANAATVLSIAAGAGVPPDLVAGVAEIVSQSNALLNAAALAEDGVALLAAGTRISALAQDDTAGALEHAGETGDVSQALAAFTGGALEDRVAAQASGDVDGPGVQNAPVAADDAFGPVTRAGLAIAPAALLANDVDYDGDALTAAIVQGPAHGTLVASGGAYVYTPDAGYVGADSFTYTASDGTLTGNEATVMLDVDATNRAPIAATLGPSGTLDPTFGAGGVAATNVTWTDAPHAMVVQADGRVVVAAATQDLEGHTSYAIARYLADGTLDSTFGDGGIVLEHALADDASIPEVALAKLAVRGDGSIALAATTEAGDIAVYRYTADGARDTTFDGDGALVTDLGADERVNAVAFDADGRVLVAGAKGDSALLVRYDSGGALDATLDGDGVVTYARPFTPSPVRLRSINSANDVAVQEDGKIVVAGGSGIFERSFGAHIDLTLIRYNPDGTLDETFGSGGVATDFIGVRASAVASSSAAQSIAIGPDGDFAVAATVNRRGGIGPVQERFGIGHYDSEGQRIAATLTVIEERDSNGKPSLQRSQAHDVAFDAQGRIVAAGTSSSAMHVALARYDADLTLDASFDGDGRAVLSSLQSEFNRGVRIGLQADGRIVTLVDPDNGLNGDVGLVRVLAGELRADASENQPFSHTLLAALFSDPDGDALAFSATRADGSPLPSWLSFDGATLTLSGTPRQGDEGVLEVRIVASDGALDAYEPLQIVVANTNDAPVVQRTAVDTHFGESGRTAPPPAEWSAGYAVAIHGDGVVVSGEASIDGVQRALLARYDASGALDASFGQDGVVYSDFRSMLVAVDADGRIVTATDTQQDFVLSRYNVDGTIDTSFGDNGRVTSDFGSEEAVLAVAVAPDGTIVAAGFQRDGLGLDLAIARYDASGALDAGFGSGGFAALHVDNRVATDVVLQADGRIVIGSDVRDTDGVVLLRLAADGELDPTFGAGGVALAALPFQSSAAHLAVDSAGNILLAGSVFTDRFETAVARFDPNGALDTTYGDSGIATGGAGGVSTGVVLQPDDSAVVLAEKDLVERTALTVTRYDASGEADRSLTLDFEPFLFSGGLALQADGGLIVGATANDGVNVGALALARVLLDVEMPDAAARVGEAFAAAVPIELFADPDGDALSYDAVLTGGGALPEWLSFDGSTRIFSGTPDAGDVGTLDITVTASDPFGLTAADTFALQVVI